MAGESNHSNTTWYILPVDTLASYTAAPQGVREPTVVPTPIAVEPLNNWNIGILLISPTPTLTHARTNTLLVATDGVMLTAIPKSV